jgi:hypothetical protein
MRRHDPVPILWIVTFRRQDKTCLGPFVALTPEMTNVPATSFEGRYLHSRTGRAYAYLVSCQVAVDASGRELVRVRGEVSRGGAHIRFSVQGHADSANSFVGREQAVALDCVAVACARGESGSVPLKAGTRLA